MALSGNLNTMSFGDLLQFISANGSSGTLQIRQGQIVKMIFFEKGKIISSSSSDPKDYLGHFLVSQGLITEEELRIAMEIQRSSKMLLGKILVMGGKVSEDDMITLLKTRTEETVYSLFLWDEGEFTFYQDEIINRLFVRISLDPQAMIFEGALRRDEWVRMRKVFPNNNVVLVKTGKIPDLEATDQLTKMIYEKVDGARGIDDISLAVHSTDYKVARILFAFYEGGFLEISKFLDPSISGVRIKGGDHSVAQLLMLGREKLDKGRFEEAYNMLREVSPSTEGYQANIVPLLEKAEQGTIREIYEKSLSPDKVPQLLVPLEELAKIKLSPQEGFILSRLDGSWDIRSILSVTPMKEVDALRLLKRMVDRGIIGLK